MQKLDGFILNHKDVRTVIDLGGAEGNWAYTAHRPTVTILNIVDIGVPSDSRFVYEVGDATATNHDDDAFDLAFSNSVIEHVGEERWEAFAAECRRLAPNVFVQTPARVFPFEPHLLTPFVHYLPKRAQRALLRNFTVWGLLRRPSIDRVERFVASTTLLRRRDMERLFPDFEIHTERFLGIPKSYLAVRVAP